MSRFAQIIEGIGFVLILFGGSAMDSEIMVLPITIAMAGCGLLLAGTKMEEFI